MTHTETLHIPRHCGARLGEPACDPRYYGGFPEGAPKTRWTPESRAAYEAKMDWFHNARYGLMLHFSTQIGAPDPRVESRWTPYKWNDWVNAVDVDKVAAQAQEVGAGYVMSCVTQAGRYYCGTNPVLEEYWGLKPLQYGTERDLMMDLARALQNRGIRMMLYHAPCNFHGLRLPSGMSRATAYRHWLEVMQWMSDHYGAACSGWWLDGTDNFIPDYRRDAYAALRHGNPDAIISAGDGEYSDFVHGHCTDNWADQQTILPYFGRWEPDAGLQWHQFQYLGPDWGAPGLAHSTPDMIAYMRKIAEGGGVMTFDLGVHDGKGNGPRLETGPYLEIADDQMTQLCAIRDALKDIPVTNGDRMRQQTLQRLLMTVKDEFIELHAAWPRHWTDTFTLEAPQDISIGGRVEDGVLVELQVTPADRRQDIKLPMQNGRFDERSETKPFAWASARRRPLTAAGWQVSRSMPTTDILSAPCVGLDQDAGWEEVWNADPLDAPAFIGVNDLRGPDGIVYLARKIHVAKAGEWILHVGHDGGARVFVDGESVGGEAGEVNPTPNTRTQVRLDLAAGEHEIVVALDRAGGFGWGIYVTFGLPEGSALPASSAVFPQPA